MGNLVQEAYEETCKLGEEEAKMIERNKEELIIERVNRIKNIESDQGQHELNEITLDLRKRSSNDVEGGTGMSKISFMPWQNTESREIERDIKKEVYALAKDRSRLLKPRSAHDFEFDFKIEAYVFVACVMLKYDSNLVETREALVPDEISEDDFWCNYFYAIECVKAELGLPTRLGERIDESKRQ
jgi:hypothetical protein